MIYWMSISSKLMKGKTFFLRRYHLDIIFLTVIYFDKIITDSSNRGNPLRNDDVGFDWLFVNKRPSKRLRYYPRAGIFPQNENICARWPELRKLEWTIWVFALNGCKIYFRSRISCLLAAPYSVSPSPHSQTILNEIRHLVDLSRFLADLKAFAIKIIFQNKISLYCSSENCLHITCSFIPSLIMVFTIILTLCSCSLFICVMLTTILPTYLNFKCVTCDSITGDHYFDRGWLYVHINRWKIYI